MDLELKKSCLDTFETGGELLLTQEESTETIVPDYCPDIARIIKSDGKIYIHGRELHDGTAEVTGTVEVSVLYTPEGDSGIRSLNFAIPFSVTNDHRSLSGHTYLATHTELELLETRMLNPRKIFTRCKLVTHITGYQKVPLCFSTDLIAEASLSLEKHLEKQSATLLTSICEKDFTFSEEANLSPGKKGAAELLSTKVTGAVNETKVVGNKLIFKGIFTVSFLYRTMDGLCDAATTELPFSQIMEVEGAAEDSLATVDLQITGTDFQIDGSDPDGRQISIALYLHAAAFLRETRELTLLNDLYSTTYQTTYEALPINLTDYFETMTRRQTVREVLEIGVVADSILSISASCGPTNIQREGNMAILRSPTVIQALYLDEGGVPLVAERCIDVSCQLELPDDCQVFASAVCAEEVQGSLTERGIEARFPVDFRLETSSRKKCVCISTASLDTTTTKDLSEAPSLVLRCIASDETIWNVAKRYNTTIDTILTANCLESESEIPREKFLLIPRKRA